MKKKWLSALFLTSALLLAACGGDEESTSSNSGETAKSDGEQVVNKTCTTCHGGNLQGMGKTPALNDVGSRHSEEEILDIIVNGTNSGMPGGLLKGEEAEQAAKWLAQQK